MTPEELAAKEAAEKEKAAAEEAARKAAEEEAAKKKAEAEKEKLSDKEAALLRDVMKQKEKAKAATDELTALKSALGDLTADDVKALAEAKRKAEEEKAQAEEEAAKKAGDWEKLQARLVHQHKTELGKVTSDKDKQIADLQAQLAESQSQIHGLVVSNAFASSKYLAEELILTPRVAEKLYGDAFKAEKRDGKPVVVAYLGTEPLVDAEGKPLSFDDAFREIVNRDPEKETLIKSKAKPGAGSGDDGKEVEQPKEQLHGVAAIAAGLNKQSTTKR